MAVLLQCFPCSAQTVSNDDFSNGFIRRLFGRKQSIYQFMNGIIISESVKAHVILCSVFETSFTTSWSWVTLCCITAYSVRTFLVSVGNGE